MRYPPPIPFVGFCLMAWVSSWRILPTFIDVICNGELIDPGFEFGFLGFGRGNDEIEVIYSRWLGFAADEIDVNLRWDFNISLCSRSEECELFLLVKG